MTERPWRDGIHFSQQDITILSEKYGYYLADVRMGILGTMLSSRSMAYEVLSLVPMALFNKDEREALIYSLVETHIDDSSATNDLYVSIMLTLTHEHKCILGNGSPAQSEEYIFRLIARALDKNLFYKAIDVLKSCIAVSEILKESKEFEYMLSSYVLNNPKKMLVKAIEAYADTICAMAQSTDKISQFKLLSDVVNGSNSLADKIQERHVLYEIHGKPVYDIETGYIELDDLLGGLGFGSLCIIAARPSMGKSAFGVNILRNIMKKQINVGCISLEMNASQVVERLISLETGVSLVKIKVGSMNKSEVQRILDVLPSMCTSMKMVINDSSLIENVDKLRSIIRRMVKYYGCKVILVDYLQLIDVEGETKNVAISDISRCMKTLAVEHNIVIMCLSQLSRRVEERVGHRPQMSDLRDSGSIEQDADQVIFLLRPNYYDQDIDSRDMHVIVAKNRHGAIGTVTLDYEKETCRISDQQQISIYSPHVFKKKDGFDTIINQAMRNKAHVQTIGHENPWGNNGNKRQ
ncbi:MAG: DnaB-like helicase C-terminal domain-containing protein [Paraclostridium sp.]